MKRFKFNLLFKVLSILIPVVVLLWLLYVNFLPFGYSDTQTIDVGSMSDLSGKFHLESNAALGSRQEFNGSTFRVIDGVSYAVYSPSVVLRNASVRASLKGSNVSFVLAPFVDIDWDYDFNVSDFLVSAPESLYRQFMNGSVVSVLGDEAYATLIRYNSSLFNVLIDGVLEQDSSSLVLKTSDDSLVYSLPDYYIGREHEVLVGHNGSALFLFVDSLFVGSIPSSFFTIDSDVLISQYSSPVYEKVSVRNGCMYFDGSTRLTLPDSSDSFESGPFSVYVNWIPEVMNDSQQLIGHYNWEIWQDSDQVRFRVGRMDNSSGASYGVSFPVKDTFFNRSHTLLAVYNPGENGYIELYVDDIFADRIYFGNETIWDGYGSDDLSLGWTPHNYEQSPYFEGSICNVKFGSTILYPNYAENVSLQVQDLSVGSIKIPFIGTNGTLNSINIYVEED